MASELSHRDTSTGRIVKVLGDDFEEAKTLLDAAVLADAEAEAAELAQRKQVADERVDRLRGTPRP